MEGISKGGISFGMAILGTSGAGKTFTLQLMAMRMREKNVRVFILSPLKGQEFRRVCHNIDGEFIQISPASNQCINIYEDWDGHDNRRYRNTRSKWYSYRNGIFGCNKFILL